MGSTILKNDFEYFQSKISLFWPPDGIKRSRFCHYCSLLLLCCSFGSLCVRFLAPSKTAWGSTPVLFSPSSPFCKNDGMHSTCPFMNFVCNFVFSLWISCFTHPFLQLFCHFFWNSASRPRWGAWFSKMHERKIMAKPTSQAFQSHGLHLSWRCLWHLEFAKSVGKCVFLIYVPSLEALFAPMCYTACILHEIYIFSPCCHDFASNLTLLSEVTSHTYVRLPLPARYVVCMSQWCLWIHWIHWIHRIIPPAL